MFTRLKFERLRRGWSQDELSRRTNRAVNQPHIGLIENGRLTPERDQLEALAFALRISPPEILLKPVAIADPEPEPERAA